MRRLTEPGQTHTWRRLPNALRFIWNFERVNRPRIEALRLQVVPTVPVTCTRAEALAAALGC